MKDILDFNSLVHDGCFPSVLTLKNHYWTKGNEETKEISAFSPIDGRLASKFRLPQEDVLKRVIDGAKQDFKTWRSVPPPIRGELIRLFGNHVRENKTELAELITLETGKIVQEAQGEVQEVIDVCDFAVGLSRQLHGLTIATERPNHRMMEQWHPLGPVLIVTAFNFPMAVWAWNAMLALVCGNTLVWKPSEQAPLCAIAMQLVLKKAWSDFAATKEIPELEMLSSVILGNAQTGMRLVQDPSFPLVSATGSIPMGKNVAQSVARRLGRTLLELGGNNAMIVTPSANLDLAVRAAVFSAVGTTGQRCTSLRRLIIHRSICSSFIERMHKAYQSLNIGDPRDASTLVGPLINEKAFLTMQEAINTAKKNNGKLILGGERVTKNVPENGFYVRPAIVDFSENKHATRIDLIQQETFAPLVYVLAYEELEEAFEIHNQVPQGLSSAIFTNDICDAERFLSAMGSDCGIANVNIGTSGAEIGGAFGGEKETGGGRESGSDAWKNYMRRTTNTINYGSELPLAQGIQFNL